MTEIVMGRLRRQILVRQYEPSEVVFDERAIQEPALSYAVITGVDVAVVWGAIGSLQRKPTA